MKKRTAIGIGITVIVLGAVGAFFFFSDDGTQSVKVSTIERTLTPSDLAREADLIVLGTFTDSAPTEVIDGDNVLDGYNWTLVPTEVWKGTAPDPLVVTIIGGKGSKTIVEDFQDVEIKKGTEALVYLSYVPQQQEWVLLSMRQGMYFKKNGKLFDLADKEVKKDVLFDEVKKLK